MTRQRFETNPVMPTHADRVDAAKLQALQARREAIDEFWTAVGRGLASALRALRAQRAQRPAVGYLAKS